MPDPEAESFRPEGVNLVARKGWKGMAWQPVLVQRSVTVSGGHSKDHLMVDALEVDSAVAGGKDDDVFIRLDKNSPWLLQVVGGNPMKKGGLCRSKVVTQLRDKSASGDNESVSSSPQKRQDVDEEVDAMDELDDCKPANEVQLARQRKAYFSKRQKQQVVVVKMPLHALDRSSGCERDVRLLATSTNSLWISQEDIPWLVCYVTDEVMKGGVAAEAGDSPALEENTSVPHLNVRWDWDSCDAWMAEFVAGDLAGTKVSSRVREGLSQAKWDSINGDSRYKITLAKASFKQKKNAVWEYMCAVCQKMLDERVAENASSSSAAPSS